MFQAGFLIIYRLLCSWWPCLTPQRGSARLWDAALQGAEPWAQRRAAVGSVHTQSRAGDAGCVKPDLLCKWDGKTDCTQGPVRLRLLVSRQFLTKCFLSLSLFPPKCQRSHFMRSLQSRFLISL